MEIGKVYCKDVIEFGLGLPKDTFDLIVTSPPYAQKREGIYQGVDVKDYAQWLLKVSIVMMGRLKPTGSFVLNIKEGVVKGKRETHVLEYLLEMAKRGWWAETFIWSKTNPMPCGNKKRLKDGFEYCYQFTKTNDYQFFPENVLVPANPKWLADNLKRKNKGNHFVNNGSGMNMKIRTVDPMVRPSNVIVLPTNTTNTKHPATFPIGLPKFFINLMTKEGDLVLDPFCGSGQTLLACMDTNRHWVGNDFKQEYVDLTMERINKRRDNEEMAFIL